MLKLKNITKDYVSGPSVVKALKGIDLEFRESEFVAILGPSGCGKTTLLNIIGGLDRYTSGDLIINGKSTKTFKDRDWDTYRNHSIGFVFQSYNLIPHQTVLANVELALTLSGVSKKERRKRAADALRKVGLGDQLHKKPSQMSGGQMQRVAIARALVNDPDILLADEPTGALDTNTSVQIMEILKEISKDKLIIMVTHNPELAETYATRIIKAVDGLVIDDSDPYIATDAEVADAVAKRIDSEAKKKKNKKKTSMSFFTALSLSLNNLATKKGRTAMTSFAGSIGIIGIALILALSSGINAFILQVQEDTLSTYPLSIQKESSDISAMLGAMTAVNNTTDYKDTNMIYIDNSMGTMLSAMSSTVSNDLVSFKKYLDEHYDEIKDYVSDVQYTYGYDFQIYNLMNVEKDDEVTVVPRLVGMETILNNMGGEFSGFSDLMAMSGSSGIDVFSEMINNQDLLDQQYELVHGDWPKEANQVVLVVDSNNQLSRMTLYMLGILDPENIEKEMIEVLGGNKISGMLGGANTPSEDESSSSSESTSTTETEAETELYDEGPFEYSYFTGLTFKILTNADFFVIDEGKPKYEYPEGSGKWYPVWKDVRGEDQKTEVSAEFIDEHGIELKIAGIVRPKPDATSASISGSIGYTHALTELMLDKTSKSEVIIQQKECYDEETGKGYNVLTGFEFTKKEYNRENIDELISKVDKSTMENFYTYMSYMIRSNPEYSALLQVNRTNLNTMFMILPEKDQAAILKLIVDSANANNPMGTTMTMNSLTNTVASSGLTGITVSADNIVQLLPVLNSLETMPVISALGIPGLLTLADQNVLEATYNSINEKYPELNMSSANFMTAIATLSEEEQIEVYTAIIDSINEGNYTMLNILCAIISREDNIVTVENLATSLPKAHQMMAGMVVNGISGLADFADAETMAEVYSLMNEYTLNLEVDDRLFNMLLPAIPDNMFDILVNTLYESATDTDETYESILKKLDNQELESPASVNFYAKDFESKEKIEAFIKDYNAAADKEYNEYVEKYKQEHDGKAPEGVTSKAVQYSDLVGALMSSVTTIVNVISYVLIAFVAISLVVSSIMIGIITNISVLERTKEIGILRAIGASKKDVSRVFNAETVIIGFCAGMLGVIVTSILCIPASLIIQYLTGFNNLTAYVPLPAAIILVVISVLLTMIAGIIPARSAAKKDPVIALRSE